jgi:hypothetical protein
VDTDEKRCATGQCAVLWRRLELLGDAEYLRILRPGALGMMIEILCPTGAQE